MGEAPQLHESVVVLISGASALCDFASTFAVVGLGHGVQAHLARLVGVELLVSLSDDLLSGLSKLLSQVLSEASPFDLRLVPILLVGGEECLVIGLVKNEFKLLDGPN